MSQRQADDGSGVGQIGDGGFDRRTFIKAAGAGAGAFALGSGFTGSATAGIQTPRLAVDGNTFVDPEGNPVTLRGVNVIDPRRADALAATRGKNAVQMVEKVTGDGWETQVVRVPLQPCDIAERETGYCAGPVTPGSFSRSDLETYLEDHVDPVVDACQQAGVYCILDYHRHWTNGSAEGSNPDFDGTWGDKPSATVNTDLQDECVMFWDVVAGRYGQRPHTLYEVYNEPTEPGMWENPLETGWVADVWYLWVKFVQPAMDTIREHTTNPILLGSPSWTQSPEGILLTEDNAPSPTSLEFRQVEDPEGNLAVTYHTYPGHNVSRDQAWAEPAGNGEGTAHVYEEYPLVVTEFGWDDSIRSRYLKGSTSEYGDPILNWMESGTAKDAVSWTAWCADIWWTTTMFDRTFEGTDTELCDPYSAEVPQDCTSLPCEWTLLTGEDHMGDTIKQKIADLSDHNNPQVGASGTVPPGTTEPPTTEPPTTEPPNQGETPPAWPDGTQPTDPNGDGVFENLNGNERIDSDDVVVYFENYDQPYMADNAGFYDLNDNGRLDSDDVVVLFESL